MVRHCGEPSLDVDRTVLDVELRNARVFPLVGAVHRHELCTTRRAALCGKQPPTQRSQRSPFSWTKKQSQSYLRRVCWCACAARWPIISSVQTFFSTRRFECARGVTQWRRARAPRPSHPATYHHVPCRWSRDRSEHHPLLRPRGP